MMTMLENIAFLGQQGLALHGDGNDNTAHFYQLVLLQVKHNLALQKWIEKSYDCHMTTKAQNEILKLLTLRLLRKIAADIHSVMLYPCCCSTVIILLSLLVNCFLYT